LVAFKECIGFNGSVKIRSDGKAVRLRLNHAQLLASDLSINYKVTPNKSLHLEPPPLSDDLALSFIVGYIDGDGWIIKLTEKSFALGILGTYSMLEWVRSQFCLLSPKLCEKTITRRNCVGEIYQLSISTKHIYKLNERVASLNLPLMKRKWSKL
jgi:hypothetical protein